MSGSIYGITRTVVCVNEHKVDFDEESQTERSATVGMIGQATRDEEVEDAEASNAYSVVWANGGWGFYSESELAAETEFLEDALRDALEKCIKGHCPNDKMFCGSCSPGRELLRRMKRDR